MGLTLGIDIGGTFTDAVLVDADGTVRTFKSPTTPDDLLTGLLDDIALAAEAMDRPVAELLGDVERIVHGTTAATNAYIERRGARTALLTTHGFEDIIFQQRMMGMTAGLSRSELTDYSRRRVPRPLCDPLHVYGIKERVDYSGKVVTPLADEEVGELADALAAEGIEAVAVCLLWSFRNPAHEQRIAAILRERLPDAFVSVSSELVPRLGEYERTATTLANAYLGPAIHRYAGNLARRLADEGSRGSVLLLDSNGGAMTPPDAAAAPVRLLLSGPSGGLTACQRLGRERGEENVITFDMGGTSTDVGLIVGGRHVQRTETEIDGFHLMFPMADIRTIGAGGGSIARVEEGGYLRVGPESAGADPGPACYGRGGGRPTVTDANVVLGIIGPGSLLGGRLQLDREAAERAIAEHVGEPLGLSVAEAAAGIRRIVDERMADLLRTVTIERGHDPRGFVLYAFGGAGAAHAPSFALNLVDRLVVPYGGSVHSAFGAAASDLAFSLERAEPLRATGVDGADAIGERVRKVFAALEADAGALLAEHRASADQASLRRVVEMRFLRQTKELEISADGALGAGALTELTRRFREDYAQRYGEEALPDSAGVELVTFKLEVRIPFPRPTSRPAEVVEPGGPVTGHRQVFDLATSAFAETIVHSGERLEAGALVPGPAVIEYPGTTVLVPSDVEARVDPLLNLELTRSRP